MNLRREHILNFMKLSPAERLQWALSTGRSNFAMLSPEKQEKYLKMRSRGQRKH